MLSNKEFEQKLNEMTNASNLLVQTFDKVEQFNKYQKVLGLSQEIITELYQSTKQIYERN